MLDDVFEALYVGELDPLGVEHLGARDLSFLARIIPRRASGRIGWNIDMDNSRVICDLSSHTPYSVGSFPGSIVPLSAKR